jgi:hypothetical protein
MGRNRSAFTIYQLYPVTAKTKIHCKKTARCEGSVVLIFVKCVFFFHVYKFHSTQVKISGGLFFIFDLFCAVLYPKVKIHCKKNRATRTLYLKMTIYLKFHYVFAWRYIKKFQKYRRGFFNFV